MTRLWAAAWLIWIGWFVIWEGAAFLAGRPDLTFSDFTWRFEGTGPTAAQYLVAAVMIWATLHLVWRLFR